MANTKLDRIEREIEKTRAKILEQQKKLKDLEAQKIEEENALQGLSVFFGIQGFSPSFSQYPVRYGQVSCLP